jgi:hypothetical protein
MRYSEGRDNETALAACYSRPARPAIMDEIVLQALRRWPDVPSVYGWLSLDRRGNWAIKDERVRHPALIDYIRRNYDVDERGRWFFQNGPQRVFVRLAYTPLVFRTQPGVGGLALAAHTGTPIERVSRAWLDEQGALLIETVRGIGVVHDQDLPEVLAHLLGPDGIPMSDEAIEQLMDDAAGANAGEAVTLRTAAGVAPVFTVLSDEVPARFGFDPDPRPAPGEPEC